MVDNKVVLIVGGGGVCTNAWHDEVAKLIWAEGGGRAQCMPGECLSRNHIHGVWMDGWMAQSSVGCILMCLFTEEAFVVGDSTES